MKHLANQSRFINLNIKKTDNTVQEIDILHATLRMAPLFMKRHKDQC